MANESETASTTAPEGRKPDGRPDGKPEGRKAEEKPRWQWLTNNEERQRILVLRGTLNTTTKTSVPGPRIDLMPGANIVDARLWSRWKDENPDRTEAEETVPGKATELLKHTIPHSGMPARRSEGSGKPYLAEGPAVRDRAAPLSGLNEREALAVVAELFDEPMLRRLIQVERRSTVAEAIRKQLEEYARADRSPLV